MSETINVPASGGIPPVPEGAGKVIQGTGSGALPQNQPAVQQPAQTQPAAQQAQLPQDYAEYQAWKAAQSQKAQPAPAANTAPVTTTVPGTSADPKGVAMAEILVAAAPGLDLNRAIGKALGHGYDARLIDEAYIRETAGADAERVLTLARGLVEHTAAEATSTVNSIYSLAGGQQQWDSAVALFNEKAPAAMKALVAAALNTGSGDQIKNAATMVVDYVKTSGLIANITGAPVNGVVNASSAEVGLSAAQYKQQVGELIAKHRNSPTFEAEYERLTALRYAGKQQNI